MTIKIIEMKDNVGHIYIYGDVDSSWGFSSKELRTELGKLSPTATVIVHINSPGGSVYEGLAIYNILKAHPGHVETINESIAASMASIILLAGKKRKMYDNARVMIHNAAASASGEAGDLKKASEHVQSMDRTMRQIYGSNLKATETQINEWLNDETYFEADDALRFGFIDEIITVPDHVAKASMARLAARLNLKGTDEMKYETWLKEQCDALEMDVTKLTAKQKEAFQARFKKEHPTEDPAKPPPLPTAKKGDEEDIIAKRRKEDADEGDRVEGIRAAARRFNEMKLNKDTLATEASGCKATTISGLANHAVREGWSTDRFELVARRCETVDIGHIGIHSTNNNIDAKALECAVLRASRMPAKVKNTNTDVEYGYEVSFDEPTLTASEKFKDVSLLRVYDMMYRQVHGYQYNGRLNTDGFLKAARETLYTIRASGGSGNTSWSALNIFDDAANKLLWAAYNSIKTSWQSFVYQQPVTDFKSAKFYRLTMLGGYQEVGPDGLLKHGSFTDSKLTVQARTFGKMVGMTREDFINDDLGAFNGIMAGLGQEGAKFLDELFWVQLLSQLATIFPVDNSLKNYISGASTVLGVDGLTLGATAFGNQVDADNSPIGQDPEILLVGTNNSVIADELYKKTQLQGLQTANAKVRPDDNPHVSKYRPVVAPWMNNVNVKQRIARPPGAAIPGQSQTHWIMTVPPKQAMGGIILGAFLNGNLMPTIEQGDADFSVLGMLWRAFHDAGASNGDPKLGVYSKGAA